MTNPTAIQTDSPRRRRTAPTPQEQRFEATYPLRRQAVRRYGWWTPDADAAAAAGVWEAIAAGKTSNIDLLRAAQREVKLLRRHEERQWRGLASNDWDRTDPAERVVEKVDAELFVRRCHPALPVPSEQAWEWIDRVTGASDRSLSTNERRSGTRWAERVRSTLGVFDEVA